MKGQITIAEYFSYGACLRREGYTNTYDASKPEENSIVDVVDHDGNRFRTALYINEFGNWVYDATKGKGYDICWWKVVRPFNEKDKEKYLKPPEEKPHRDPYTVYYIAYVWMTSDTGKKYWNGVWNKRGMALEFPDREHAEYFIRTHPQVIKGREYEIRERKWHFDPDQMEYGHPLNVWEGEE